MGSLARKIARAAKARKFSLAPKPSHTSDDGITDEGIFCDCYGTLYSHSFERDDLLVRFLNAKHRAGIPVTLVSSDAAQVAPYIRDIGLHPDIVATLSPKSLYYKRTMEILIDDDPVIIKARTHYHPSDPKFRGQMQNFFGNNNPAPAPGR